MLNLFELTQELIKIPSVSGEEQAVGAFLGDYLKSLGYAVEMQEVVDGRRNVIAWASDNPRVFLSTHMDTVPPFIAPAEDEENIYGRGACDAKGIIAAQITAAEQLLQENVFDIGLLFTVDEEQSSKGAQAANKHPIAQKCQFMINGEPTDNELGIGSKGSLRVFLRTKGKAAHSAYPETGESAIEKLLDVLEDIRQTQFPNDEFFGETTCNIGTISGGLKTNVIPPSAEAGIHIRLTTPFPPIQRILERVVNNRAEIEIASVVPPIKMQTVEGFPQKVVRFTTDIPNLSNWGTPLLLGAGSILVAHTKDEFVSKQELSDSVQLYCGLVKQLLRVSEE
jgi:acetylornithine deacetylase